jgi:hypothetical protein
VVDCDGGVHFRTTVLESRSSCVLGIYRLETGWE